MVEVTSVLVGMEEMTFREDKEELVCKSRNLTKVMGNLREEDMAITRHRTMVATNSKIMASRSTMMLLTGTKTLTPTINHPTSRTLISNLTSITSRELAHLSITWVKWRAILQSKFIIHLVVEAT